MRYHSTRSLQDTVSGREAVFRGLAPDGGLYVTDRLNSTRIDPAVYEAARIAGASDRQIDWYITLPLLRPMIGTISVMAANYGLLLYNEIALITSGGPDNATYSLSYYIYKTSLGSTKLNFARGNTAGVIQFILGIVIVCLINRAFRSDTSD